MEAWVVRPTWGTSTPVRVEADTVRVDHGVLVFTTAGRPVHLIADGAWVEAKPALMDQNDRT